MHALSSYNELELTNHSAPYIYELETHLFLSFSFSGVIGSGVCVFSRYPIIDAFAYRYSLNGYMYNITHGDWFGGKAIGYCVIDHPKQPIHFFTTHVSKAKCTII